MTPDETYRIVANHVAGIAIIARGGLVDTCPTLESAERMAAALNELDRADSLALSFALPAVSALTHAELQRVVRHLAKQLHARA
jgi:hypothetical protein